MVILLASISTQDQVVVFHNNKSFELFVTNKLLQICVHVQVVFEVIIQSDELVVWIVTFAEQ